MGVALSAEEELPSTRPGFNAVDRTFGDYILGPQIGAGGMGVVYEAQRAVDQRRVALKLIRDLHIASPALLCRFTIEAEAIARLEHPHIVRIHEVGETEGHPFFSMDLVTGDGLDLKIARGDFDLRRSEDPSRRQRDIAQWMAKVARAVQHAHTRGVLHRDIKPANILFDAAGEPRLTDFGLAKILLPDRERTNALDLTTSGVAPGTPSYMAPEQVAGGDAGGAADIYGLGAVLFATLAGHPPFRGATPLELFKQITTQSPPRLRALQPAVHADLETICLKCLEKDPHRRYGSAEALAEDLEHHAAGRPIRARPPGVAYRSRQWIRHNPVGTALIVSLCLGLFVALALLKVVNDQRREMEADRDQTFDEGMQKISQIWRDPATHAVTISSRELAILAERSPADLRGARHQLTFGISANDGPSSTAQRYARMLGHLQEQISRDLGEKVIFDLQLMKRFTPSAEHLARGEVDFLVLSAAEFIEALERKQDLRLVGREGAPRDGVIFTRTNSGLHHLADLRGRTLALPDPSLALTVQAKARIAEAGVRRTDLRSSTNITDRAVGTATTLVGATETVDRVLRGEVDVGVTYRSQFERYRHLGLMVLEPFTETPALLAARAGLEPRLVAAMRNALRTPADLKSWPDNKFVPASAGDKAEGSTELEPLRRAIRDAARFDE